ncbi:hypothetical protein [Natronolimnohabitans innermongolicus]|uniref:Uncharacterized protein n=1 Tax=Natronolimnohabitans innermongolicus JCM 12255 TaxID=1227499 RepID=L9WI90_9EURY|nr:hypothetical protein [Natronolimnohabitans innermongolicus]ELY48951.1 hypothetical protein C493_21181 [Natronolimnohabitans innermongolicus JCM 12255]
MSSIVIDRVHADGTTLEADVQTSADLERFFGDEPFQTEYDVSIEDVPEGVLAIPVLAHVCPVAWANGADVYVDEVDETFANALSDVEESLCAMHDFLEGGTLYAKETVDVEPDASGESGLLFTGGVDSTCSYVRHREESPTLISIRGWTITPSPSDDENWTHLRNRVTSFADDHDLETAFVESNMLSFLDHPMLLAHYKRYVDGAWYSSVGHGVGLLGLCAPMAYARGMEDLYVAATHWEGIDLEWGSRPDIDDHVRWTGTQCHHDSYDLTRQERLDAIADYVREEEPALQLQTCNARMDGNCGECEKCYRTAVGLRLSDLEPTDHGYPFAEEDYREIRTALEEGQWVLGQDEKYMWEDISERARETDPESPAEAAFFEWLERADLDDLVSESGPPLSHRLLRAGARNAPTKVYNTVYPAWTSAKSGLRRVGR